MGNVAAQSLDNSMYVIGFTAYAGAAGTWFNAPITLPQAQFPSLEWHFNEAGLTNAFLDLRTRAVGGGWLDAPIMARPLGYGNMIASWPRHLDAFIYTRDDAQHTGAVKRVSAWKACRRRRFGA
ncbi:MAG: erythromycin esterase family protein [Gemmatimonadota bacterium]